MRIERALAIRSAAGIRLRDLYSSATIQGLTSDEIQAGWQHIRKDYPKAPQWVWSYLDGYKQALNDSLYRDHLIFGGYIGERFYSTSRGRSDYYESCGIDPAAYADDGLVKRRGHYWRESMPFKGGTYTRGIRPYFIGE